MQIKKVLLAALLAISADTVNAQCEDQQARLAAVERKYVLQFKKLEASDSMLGLEARDLTEEEPGKGHHIPIQITNFRRREFSLNIVSVTMREKKVSMKIPEIIMHRKTMSIPTSTIKIKTKWVLGIKTDVPVIVNSMKHVHTDVPEITMKNVTANFKVPEFKTERKDFSISVPEFKLEKPIIPEDESFNDLQRQSNRIKRRADSLNRIAGMLGAEQKKEMQQLIADLYSCMIDTLTIEKTSMAEAYDASILEISQSMAQVEKNGFNPDAIKSDDGTVLNLTKMKDEIIAEKQKSLGQISASITDLETSRDKLLKELAE